MPITAKKMHVLWEWALFSCTVPAVGKPTFDISDNEIEMGIGIHGELEIKNKDKLLLK